MCRSVSVGSMGVTGGGVVCCPAHVSICDTFNAAGPHSPSGMWDFQVENRASSWEEQQQQKGGGGEEEGWGEKMTCMI